MRRLEDSTARLEFSVDASLGALVRSATRSYLRLYHLSRPTSEFITRQLQGAIRRLPAESGNGPLKVSLTLRSHAGRVLVALRVSRAGTANLRLGPLAKGAPATVQAAYRRVRGGGTLSFSSSLPRLG